MASVKKKLSFLNKLLSFFSVKNIILLGIFGIALLVRLINLSTIPNGFHIDELVSGFVGRFILLHGKDPYGNSWPLLYFDMFGDYRVILPMYINGLSTFIFGVNEFAVRFPSAFIGSLIVFPIFSLSETFFGKRKLTYIPSFLIAILPWHIVLSRATSEGIVGLTFFTYGLSFALQSIIKKNNKLYIISLFFLFITYFMYPTFRVLSPLVLLSFPFLVEKKQRKIYGVGLFVFIVLTAYVGTTVWGKGRYLQTSLFSNSDIVKSIQGQNTALNASEGTNNVIIARIFNNKAVAYSQLFIGNYLSYFSPNFLFIQGGLPVRYVVPNDGLIYVTLLILFLFYLIPQKNFVQNKYIYLLFYLLCISPVASVLTIDDVPNVHRVLFMMIPLIFIGTLGLEKITSLLTKHRNILYCTISVLFILISTEFIYFWHRYTVQAPTYKSILRDDGIKQVVNILPRFANHPVYMPVYEAIPAYYLFFTNNFDKKFADDFGKGLKIDKINNINFVNDWCPPVSMNRKNLPSNAIIIESGECQDNPHYLELFSIKRKDDTVAFRILQFLPNVP